jgi:hypothetical protein
MDHPLVRRVPRRSPSFALKLTNCVIVEFGLHMPSKTPPKLTECRSVVGVGWTMKDYRARTAVSYRNRDFRRSNRRNGVATAVRHLVAGETIEPGLIVYVLGFRIRA